MAACLNHSNWAGFGVSHTFSELGYLLKFCSENRPFRRLRVCSSQQDLCLLSVFLFSSGHLSTYNSAKWEAADSQDDPPCPAPGKVQRFLVTLKAHLVMVSLSHSGGREVRTALTAELS